MNKSELVAIVAEEADISKSAGGRAVDAVLNAVTQSLVDGEPVVLVGFGTFLVRERATRSGRNPQTGEVMEIAASRVAAFKAGKALKDALN